MIRDKRWKMLHCNAQFCVSMSQNLKFVNFLNKLGPGRPSAGGPRMDRRAVTSLGVVKTSRLASRLRRSARRGPDPTAVLIKLFMKTLFLIQRRDRQGEPNDPMCTIDSIVSHLVIYISTQ